MMQFVSYEHRELGDAVFGDGDEKEVGVGVIFIKIGEIRLNNQLHI